ncbi:hypothetical protein, partial [Thiorhodococcus fuscus]
MATSATPGSVLWHSNCSHEKPDYDKQPDGNKSSTGETEMIYAKPGQPDSKFSFKPRYANF